MIKEFAIDPRFAANVPNIKLISALFDYHKPRRISKFPKSWESLVYDNTSNLPDLDKTRIVEKLIQLKSARVLLPAGRNFYERKSWVENAIEVTAQSPFQAVLSDAGATGFINSSDFDTAHPQIQLSDSVRIKKEVLELEGIFKPVLIRAKRIWVVDPYFSMYDSGCCRLFNEWLSVLNSRADAAQIILSICTSSDRRSGAYKAGDEGKMSRDIASNIHLGSISQNIRVKLVPHNQDMHARYFLSDIASFSMDHSFSVDASASANINMLPIIRASDIVSQYFSENF